MPTETIQTRHGDVEVQTATCDSCGQSMLEEDALYFEVAQPDGGVAEGVACEHCATEGPASFPAKKKDEWLEWSGFVWIPAAAITAPMLIAWCVLDPDTAEDKLWGVVSIFAMAWTAMATLYAVGVMV